MFMLHRLGLFVLYFHGVFSLSRIVQLHDEARVLEEDWLMKKAAKSIQEKGLKKQRLKMIVDRQVLLFQLFYSLSFA